MKIAVGMLGQDGDKGEEFTVARLWFCGCVQGSDERGQISGLLSR